MKPSSSEPPPALATHYSNAHKSVFGRNYVIAPKMYPKFRVFEDDLRELGIPTRDYAYTVARVLKKWALDKKLQFIPVNTFLSDFALKQFLQVWNSQSVTIDKSEDHEAMLYSELMVGRAYIFGNVEKGKHVTMEKVVESLKSLLHPDWLREYRAGSKEHTKIMLRSLEMLSQECGVEDACTYDDIAKALR